MGRIHVLPEHVANKIAAGEVVERPASVVKELLENSLDAGSTRIKIQVEAGGKKLIEVTDNGCGMVRDDALLAFERHATSKMKSAEDLLSIATLGFRGEALPSIASVSRLRLETRAPEEESGTIIEINGGKIFRVEEAGLPPGTLITIRDLFFNIPARRKFLKAESTELSHIASLVTHYALAHPDKHFELHSATHAVLIAPPVAGYSERVYQAFGKEVLDQLIAIAASQPLEHGGLPRPWKVQEAEPESEPQAHGEVRMHGFVSKPEIQKLNRNSIYIFVNGRLVRDRLIQHAVIGAYRNILPASVFPVVLLFIEMPNSEVDVNVHPAKTEVRFRQQGVIHDFVRDSVRSSLMQARPVPQFTTEIAAHATAGASLTPDLPNSAATAISANTQEAFAPQEFSLQAPVAPPINEHFRFGGGIAVAGNAALALSRATAEVPGDGCATPIADEQSGDVDGTDLSSSLASLTPLGQIRESFILAVNRAGLWIIDQHVAHERVLFEKILREYATRKIESQRLLMPLILELTAAQQGVFSEISEELARNGFEAEPFGARSIAIKIAPAGLEAGQVEGMLQELLDQLASEEQALNMEKVRTRIAASVACHAAIKVNMPLEQNKMVWLLAELARTDCPMSCPHGRPVVLRYSMKDIQKAFKRI
ncbi:MAG: DNA mismatch repair endonuclease MutL [Acidobacteriales bacterium]|nr:DNA mismatch repair endonuclease MutL [Terriglobales bacterium]